MKLDTATAIADHSSEFPALALPDGWHVASLRDQGPGERCAVLELGLRPMALMRLTVMHCWDGVWSIQFADFRYVTKDRGQYFLMEGGALVPKGLGRFRNGRSRPINKRRLLTESDLALALTVIRGLSWGGTRIRSDHGGWRWLTK